MFPSILYPDLVRVINIICQAAKPDSAKRIRELKGRHSTCAPGLTEYMDAHTKQQEDE